MKEFRIWWAIAWPVSITLGCQVAMTMTDIAFLGYISTDYLAAASLASVWQSIIMITLFAFGDSIRVLCSQAKGANNLYLVGIWLQCGVFWISLLCVPVAGLFLVTGTVLRLVKIDSNLCNLAQEFANYSIIWIWPRALFNAGNSYLQSQEIVRPQMWFAILFVCINIGLNFVFIHGLFRWEGLGFIGSPIATSCSMTLLALTTYMYVIYAKLHVKTWSGWTTRSFQMCYTKDYFKQAMPVTLGRFIEVSNLELARN